MAEAKVTGDSRNCEVVSIVPYVPLKSSKINLASRRDIADLGGWAHSNVKGAEAGLERRRAGGRCK